GGQTRLRSEPRRARHPARRPVALTKPRSARKSRCLARDSPNGLTRCRVRMWRPDSACMVREGPGTTPFEEGCSGKRGRNRLRTTVDVGIETWLATQSLTGCRRVGVNGSSDCSFGSASGEALSSTPILHLGLGLARTEPSIKVATLIYAS